MTPQTSKDNPWFMEVWQRKMNCIYPYKTDTGNITIGNTTLINCDGIKYIPILPEDLDSYVVTTFDGVYGVAYALDKLIRERCFEMIINNEGVRDYIKAYNLLGYIQNSSFQCVSCIVQFDELGNEKSRMNSDYIVIQGPKKKFPSPYGTWLTIIYYYIQIKWTGQFLGRRPGEELPSRFYVHSSLWTASVLPVPRTRLLLGLYCMQG